MRDLMRQLAADARSGRAAAYCRLVETRGSTPQKAGAVMLVYPDGGQTGTLGGGCVEAEVKRRALAALADQRPEIARFQLDSDYGWDDGLICGGRMLVLVQPLVGSDVAAYFDRLAELVETGVGITEAVVYDQEASGLPTPMTFLFDADGQLQATLHARGEAPSIVEEQLKPLAQRPRPYAARGVAFLPVLPRCRLVIVGGGHVGKAVADLASDLDFDVWIVDDRQEYVDEDRFPRAERRIAGQVSDVLPHLEITADTYCLIVTRGHNHDEEALYHLVDRGARYVGLIGSRRKIKLIFEDLLDQGIRPTSLERVFAPLGIDIGSQTVPEIAVSICAELVSHRNRNGVVPGRPQPVEVSRS